MCILHISAKILPMKVGRWSLGGGGEGRGGKGGKGSYRGSYSHHQSECSGLISEVNLY